MRPSSPPLRVPRASEHEAQIVLGLGPILRRFLPLIEGKSPSADLNGFSELRVAFRRFDHFASLEQKPREGISRLGPVRLQSEDVSEEVFSLGGMIAFCLELSALEQREEIGAVLLSSVVCSRLDFLHDTGSLGGGVGEGLIHAFLGENAGHFIKDVAGPGRALDLGEGSGQFLNLGRCFRVRLFGGLSKALSFFPTLGLLRIGKGGLSSAFDRLNQLGADFLFRDVASLFADPPDLPMLAVAEPPDAAADKREKDKANGKGAEDFILPEIERPPQLGEFIAEALDLELKVGVVGGGVVKVAVVSSLVAVGELQGAALSLVAGRVGVCGIVRKIEAL